MSQFTRRRWSLTVASVLAQRRQPLHHDTSLCAAALIPVRQRQPRAASPPPAQRQPRAAPPAPAQRHQPPCGVTGICAAVSISHDVNGSGTAATEPAQRHYIPRAAAPSFCAVALVVKQSVLQEHTHAGTVARLRLDIHVGFGAEITAQALADVLHCDAQALRRLGA